MNMIEVKDPDIIARNTLLYFSKSMSVEPTNISFYDLADSLRRWLPQLVTLEPGDGTRYDLLISYSNGAMVVIRQPMERGQLNYVLLYDHDLRAMSTEDVQKLSGNEWSQVFLAWWLTKLWLEMEHGNLRKER